MNGEVKQRTFDPCVDWTKTHLWRLGNLEKPIEDYPVSQNGLVLLPLFFCKGYDGWLENFMVRGAIWARRSWVMFADVKEMQVPVKFYVEEAAKHVVLPILEQNFMSEADCIFFDGDGYDDYERSFFGKAMAMYTDEQLIDYDWIIQPDSDLFLACREYARDVPYQKIPFFAHLSQHEPQLGVVGLWGTGSPPYKTTIDLPYINKMCKSLDAPKEEKRDEYLKRLKTLVDDDVVRRYEDPNSYVTECHGGVHVFPARHMMANEWDKCEWLTKAGKVLQYDEAIFSAWHMKGEKLFDLDAELDLRFDTGHATALGRSKGDIYMFHYGLFNHEQRWKDDIRCTLAARELEGCLNPAKQHLWRLPNLPHKTEAYPVQTDKAIVLFPLFQSVDGDASLEHHLVRAAIWARQSWLLFTDVIKHGIAVKFYVEDKVKHRVLPILKENYYSEEDCIFFDGSEFEGDIRTFLGKKLHIFTNRQFENYEWVIQSDADMFWASQFRSRDVSYNFFDRLFGQEKEIGTFTAWDIDELKRTIRDMHWPNHLKEGHLNWDNRDEKDAEWLRRAESLTDAEMVKRYTDDTTGIPESHGGLYMFPAKHFMSERWSDCEWIAKAGKLLQADETTFSLFRVKGNKVWSLIHEFDIPSVAGVEEIDNRTLGDVYLSHIGNMDHEWLFQRDIDALFYPSELEESNDDIMLKPEPVISPIHHVMSQRGRRRIYRRFSA